MAMAVTSPMLLAFARPGPAPGAKPCPSSFRHFFFFGFFFFGFFFFGLFFFGLFFFRPLLFSALPAYPRLIF
jgi:hypothetical protein